MKIRIATVFSGIGSPEWALKRLGIDHEHVFACDNALINYLGDESEMLKEIAMCSTNKEIKLVTDKYVNHRKTNFVKQAYFANYNIDESRWHHDVKFLKGTEYNGKVDLFVGGSPCQSFSTSGRQEGLNSTKGTLFYEFARLVSEIKPKAFIYENVRGLLTHDKGKTWKIIKKVFDELGYNFDFKVINSKDIGIPQNRNRVFVVGFKKEEYFKKFNWPNNSEMQFLLQDLLEEECHRGDFNSVDGKLSIKKSSYVDVGERYYPSEKVMKHVMSPGTKNYITKPEIDLKVARPILATMHKMHRAAVDNYVTTKKGVRMLTERETLRLMGFDDTFKIEVSILQTYRQSGNSIVVDIMMELIKGIKETGIYGK